MGSCIPDFKASERRERPEKRRAPESTGTCNKDPNCIAKDGPEEFAGLMSAIFLARGLVNPKLVHCPLESQHQIARAFCRGSDAQYRGVLVTGCKQFTDPFISRNGLAQMLKPSRQRVN